MTNLTPKQREALKKVVRCKLRLWDAARAAELLIGREVDTADTLGDLCAAFDTVEQVDERITDGDLLELLSDPLDPEDLPDATEDCR